MFTILSSQEILERRYIIEIPAYSDKLIKVKTPIDYLNEIKLDLDTLGVNAFSIYPELEGLCTYLQWRYFES